MNQEWASLEKQGFPGYEISNDGLIRNERTLRLLKMSANQEGIVRCGLMKRDQGTQATVSVLRLVATMFVPGRSATFGTPMQLDGNRANVRADNIVWRPRWFAVAYMRQFAESSEPEYNAKIYDVESDERFANSREAAMKNGLLESVITKSVVNGSPCFPTWQIFARVSH